MLAQNLFGDDILPQIVLALGSALALGTLAALIRPPRQRAEGSLERPPVGRSVIQIVIGLLAAIWAGASLLG
ncbi:MAG: hypothetical protein HKN03_08455 [Acidimicrobiales bacterium]|nr:hypothetical protein [Acidimicrobiales bacterium]